MANQIIGAMPIGGRPHSQGGTMIPPNLTNGRLVIGEKGELLLMMKDGSKVVLNASQQQRLKNGESIDSIISELPHYAAKAQGGTEIPPQVMPSFTVTAIESPYTAPVTLEYRDEVPEPNFFASEPLMSSSETSSLARIDQPVSGKVKKRTPIQVAPKANPNITVEPSNDALPDESPINITIEQKLPSPYYSAEDLDMTTINAAYKDEPNVWDIRDDIRASTGAESALWGQMWNKGIIPTGYLMKDPYSIVDPGKEPILYKPSPGPSMYDMATEYLNRGLTPDQIRAGGMEGDEAEIERAIADYNGSSLPAPNTPSTTVVNPQISFGVSPSGPVNITKETPLPNADNNRGTTVSRMPTIGYKKPESAPKDMTTKAPISTKPPVPATDEYNQFMPQLQNPLTSVPPTEPVSNVPGSNQIYASDWSGQGTPITRMKPIPYIPSNGFNPKVRTEHTITPEYKSREEGDYFDQYRNNLIASALMEAGYSNAQAARAMLDIMKNRNKPFMPPTRRIGYVPVEPVLESPVEYLDAIKSMSASGLKVARESGMMAAEMSQFLPKYAEAVSNVREQVSKTNTGRILGTQELNTERFLRTQTANAGIEQRDKAMRMQEEALRMEADLRSKDVINKAMSGMSAVFSEFSQNKLSADIMESIYNGQGNMAQYNMILGMLYAGKNEGNPNYYASYSGGATGTPASGTVPVYDANGTIIEYRQPG